VEFGRRRASRAFKRARRLNCHRNFKPLVFTQFQPVVDNPTTLLSPYLPNLDQSGQTLKAYIAAFHGA
jgi:hypothetical protein